MWSYVAIVSFAIGAGIVFDWAFWSGLMRYLDTDFYQPNRLHWRHDLFPRIILLAFASAGMGIESQRPSPELRYLCISVFLIGTFWGLWLAVRRLRQS